MNRLPTWLLLICGCMLAGAGCCSTNRPPVSSGDPKIQGESTSHQAADGHWHSEIIHPTPGDKPVHWYNRINVIWWFGNQREPQPPPWYEPNSRFRTVKWYFRNPLSNFTWYVIGVADKETVRSGKYPDRITRPGGGWNFAVTKHKWLQLPFISYNYHHFVFYLGWRERGNFGMALRFNAKMERTPLAPQYVRLCPTARCKSEYR